MKFNLVGVAAMALLAACSSSSEKGISGTFKGAEGETIYLERFVNNRPVITDSAVVDANGNFHILPQPALELNFYQLSVDPTRRLVLITDSTEHIKVKVDSEDMLGSLTFSGSRHSELLDEFQDMIRPLEMQLVDLRAISKDATRSEEERAQAFSQSIDINQEKRQLALTFLEKNSNSPAALAALGELNVKQDLELYQKVSKALESSFSHSFYHKAINQQIANAGNGDKRQAPQQQAKNNKYSVGMEAPDIVMNDPSGNQRSLHELRGKVVMIDFWASWCGPCRRENPNVVAAYNKYNSQGFEVFSVSLDKDADRWNQAIAQDGLLWPNHVSDLQGWNNAASQAYGVSSIPHTILVGRDGKIVGTHLRGPALEAKLAELFGS